MCTWQASQAAQVERVERVEPGPENLLSETSFVLRSPQAIRSLCHLKRTLCV